MIQIKTYNADGRLPLYYINSQYNLLSFGYGFIKEPVYSINIKFGEKSKKITVFCYKSSKKGPSIWLLSGIHGEEPAGPIAIAQNINTLGKLGQEIPLVVYPLLNPKGYVNDDRYFDEHRDWLKGHSVSDSEHYLPNLKNTDKPRAKAPSSQIAATVSESVLDNIADYPPFLTVDLHEDELSKYSYIYSQSSKGIDDKAAKKAVSILEKSGLPIKKKGSTRFSNELIKDGIVVDKNSQPVKDGSIDELLCSDRIIKNGKVISKPFALTSLVVETPIIDTPLEKRIRAHSNIIKHLRLLWRLTNNQQ